VDPQALAALEHENMVEAMTGVAVAVAGARVRRSGGVAFFATGLPIRLFNQVIVEDETATNDGIVEAVGAMRARKAHFVVSLRRGTDARYVPLMADLGLELPAGHGPLPGMALDPLPAGGPSVVVGHDVHLVADATGMEDHIVTAAAGFGMPEDMIRALLGPDLWRQDGRFVYVGYADGRPVTTGLGVRTGNTIGVYNIATVESARKRGYGAAMTERIAADGAAAGCRVAILQASAMGLPIYERLGYRTVVEYDGFVEPETGS
jgi:GNAT superfamily N-acetyltransferase